MDATIAYYVSDYGYGHASRSIAVIRELLRLASEAGRRLTLNLAGGQALSFMERSLQADFAALQHEGHVLQLRRIEPEPGYCLGSGSLEADIGALRQTYIPYIQDLPARIRKESAWLGGSGCQLVVSDIVAEAFPAAAKAGIPSVGLSNFTWYTAYQDMLPPELLTPLAKAYLDMDRFIALPGAREPQWASKPQQTAGFFSRRADPAAIADLRKSLDPSGERKLICLFAGMGSGGVELLQSLPLLQDSRWLPIVSSNAGIDGAEHELVVIPAEVTESQLYVAASDLVLTKPGWGTVAEAVCYGKPLVLLERPLFREDRCTMDALVGAHPHLLMSQDQLLQPDLGERLLTWLEAAAAAGSPPVGRHGNEARSIAENLLRWTEQDGGDLSLRMANGHR